MNEEVAYWERGGAAKQEGWEVLFMNRIGRGQPFIWDMVMEP